MLRTILLGIIALSSLIALSSAANEKPTISWLTWEQPPNFITKGPFLGKGIGDSFTQALQDRLPQYHHRAIVANARRYHSLIREEDVCVAWAWIVPGSRAFRIYSRAVSLVPPSGILTLKSKRHLFGKPGETLSLEALLKNPNLVLGYLEEMKYSKRVNELMEKSRGQSNIHYSSRTNVDFDLKMLDMERLDYFFAFSSQPIFNAQIKGIENHYQFYNIEEIQMYSSMHTHCSKTPFGEKVMADVNRVLTNDLLMEQLNAVQHWYGESDRYREVFVDYVINQNNNEFVTNPGQ